MVMGRGKGPTGRTAKFKRRPRATLRMGEPKVDASSSDGSHASDTADRGTEQLGVIFSKAPEPARGRSKRETASATVPAGLRKGEVVLALPVTNVRARHAQHTGLGYVHADGGRSSQHVVTGRWAISFVGRSCGVSASRPPPPADVGRASRHGDGRPPGVLGASSSQHGRPNLSRRGTKVCIALFGFAPFLGTRVWAAAGRTGQGLAAAADAADHSRKAPTSPRHDDARRGLAGYDHDTSGRRHAAAMSGGLAGCFDGFLRITFGCDDYRGGGGRFSCSKEAESRSSTKRQGAAAFSLSGHDGLGYTRICRSLLLRVERRLRAR